MVIPSKKFILGIGFLTVVLLLAGLVVGFYSLKNMKEIVSDQFNQQQLELAQHAARQLENQFLNLTQDLAILNQSPSVQYLEKYSWANRIKITLSTMRDTGVLEIGRVDGDGGKRFAVTNKDEVRVTREDFSQTEIFKWARDLKNKNQMFFRPANEGEGFPQRQIAKVFMPTYLESADDAHPVPSHQFAGYIYLLLDRHYLVTRMIKDIRSGKTGYAWAIDNRGNFITHPVGEFIGKNAFEVREQRGPKISFDQINRIQKEKMLQGKSGTSWYVSGWHRGVQGNIKKLIAYAPVRLMGPTQPPNWAVAVVAPITEVDEVIHTPYVWQFVMQGIIIFAILLGGLVILGLEWRYTRTLEEEIKAKTVDLIRSEKRYKGLVESAQDLIFSVDRSGHFLSLNRYGVYFLSGRLLEGENREGGPNAYYAETAENFLGKSIFDYFGSESAFNPNLIDAVWTTGRPRIFEQTIRIDAQECWLSTQLIALKDEEGKVQGVLGISRDITSNKKVEQQMFNTEKLASLGLLAAGVAHEINNPLGVILGYCDYLLEKIPPEEKTHQLLEKIERQGNHCKRIVENLLSFSRYTDRADDISDINNNLENVFSVIQNNLMIKRVQLEKELEPNLPRVKADPIQLQQVFLNLINNAVAAMPQGGLVKVATLWKVHDDKIEITISDTGSGIRKEHRDRIYDPFFTTKKVGEGTGLGLTVSYGIITHYQGTVTMETKTEEEDPQHHGTRFMVTLPVYHSKRGVPEKG